MEKKYLFLDIEGTGVHEQDDKCHGIAWAKEEDQIQYTPMWNLDPEFLSLLADETVIKVIHSGKRFDLIFLQRAGLEICGPIHDTYHIFHAVDEHQPLGLKELTTKYRGSEFLKSKRRMDKECHKAGVKHIGGLCKVDLKDPDHELFPIIAKYALEDVDNTYWLYFKGKELLERKTKSIRKVFGPDGKTPLQFLGQQVFPLDSVLLDIDKRGVKADMDLLNRIRIEKEVERDALIDLMDAKCKVYIEKWEETKYLEVVASKTKEKAKNNVKRHNKKCGTLWSWSKDQEVAKMLFPHIPEKLRSYTEKKGNPSLDKDAVIEVLGGMNPNHKVHKLLTLYSEYKKVHKVASTYTGNAKTGIFSKIRDGRLWTKYYQTTKTWRLASSGPNLQNIPRKGITQKVFIPDTEDGLFWVADYSQVELMCAAHFSQDPRMLEIFREGGDLHRNTACKLFNVSPEELTDEQRQAGKWTNFLLIYRGSWLKLKHELKKKADLEFSDAQCKFFVHAFFEEYRGLDVYLRKLEASVRRRGYVYVAETGVTRSEPDIFLGEKLNWDKKKFEGESLEVKRCRDMLIREALDKGQTPNITDENVFWCAYRIQKSALNKLINFPCQHLGMYICGKTMLTMYKRGFQIVNQVHDDLKVYLAANELHRVIELSDIMENAYQLNNVKLVAEWDLKSTFHKEDIVNVQK